MSPNSSSPPFAGFPAATFEFIRGLALNNEKAWFEAHRKDYTSFYVAPALAFIETVGPRLKAEVSPAINFEPRINGSLFRINRDIRFSSDKTPYKTHLDMWFWEGDRKGWDTPGFYMRLEPERLYLGAGMHHIAPEGLATYRQAIVDDGRGAALAALTTRLEAGPYQVGADARKTVPRGFSADHSRARFLLYEGLHAMLDTPVPPEAASAVFVDYCVGHFKAVAPINDWLRETFAAAG